MNSSPLNAGFVLNEYGGFIPNQTEYNKKNAVNREVEAHRIKKNRASRKARVEKLTEWQEAERNAMRPPVTKQSRKPDTNPLASILTALAPQRPLRPGGTKGKLVYDTIDSRQVLLGAKKIKLSDTQKQITTLTAKLNAVRTTLSRLPTPPKKKQQGGKAARKRATELVQERKQLQAREAYLQGQLNGLESERVKLNTSIRRLSQEVADRNAAPAMVPDVQKNLGQVNTTKVSAPKKTKVGKSHVIPKTRLPGTQAYQAQPVQQLPDISEFELVLKQNIDQDAPKQKEKTRKSSKQPTKAKVSRKVRKPKTNVQQHALPLLSLSQAPLPPIPMPPTPKITSNKAPYVQPSAAASLPGSWDEVVINQGWVPMPNAASQKATGGISVAPGSWDEVVINQGWVPMPKAPSRKKTGEISAVQGRSSSTDQSASMSGNSNERLSACHAQDVLSVIPSLHSIVEMTTLVSNHLVNLDQMSRDLTDLMFRVVDGQSEVLKKRAGQRRVHVQARGKKVKHGLVDTGPKATMERLRKRKQLHRRRIISNVFNKDGRSIIGALKKYVTYNRGRIDARAGAFKLRGAEVMAEGYRQKTVPRIRLTSAAIRELKGAYTAEHANASDSVVRRVINNNFPRLDQGIRVYKAVGDDKAAGLARGGQRKALTYFDGEGYKRIPGFVERRRNKTQRFFLQRTVAMQIHLPFPKEGMTYPEALEFLRQEFLYYVRHHRTIQHRPPDAWLDAVAKEIPLMNIIVVYNTKAAKAHSKDNVEKFKATCYFTEARVCIDTKINKPPGMYYTPAVNIFAERAFSMGEDPASLFTRDQIVGRLRSLVHKDSRVLTKAGRAKILAEKKFLFGDPNSRPSEKHLDMLASWYVRDSQRDDANAAMSPLSAVHNYIKLVRQREGVNGAAGKHARRKPEKRPVGEERRGLTRLGDIRVLSST